MKKLFVSLSSETPMLKLDSYTGDSGCYVAVLPDEETKVALLELAFSLGFTDETAKEKFHTTVIYSKKPLKAVPKNLSNEYTGYCGKISTLVDHKGGIAVYAEISCPALHALHKTFKNHGAEHYYPEYLCHVTIGSLSKDEWQMDNEKYKSLIDSANSKLEERRIPIFYNKLEIANLHQ